MKIFVFSDLHGNAEVLNVIIRAIEREKPNKVVFCGDLFGGWGNSNAIAEKIHQIDAVKYVILGNNDGYYKIPNVDFEEYAVMYHFGRTLFFTHGHVYNGYKMPSFIGANDLLVHGHTHRTRFCKVNGVFVLNVGSCAEPRDGVACYFTLDESGATQKDLDGQILNSYPWD